MYTKKYLRKIFAAALCAATLMSGMSGFGMYSFQNVNAASAVSASTALKNNSTVSSASITKGQTIILQASASGGAGGYTYAYYYKKSGDTSWKTAKNYSTTDSVKLTPATATTYNLCIKVKDSDGTVVKKYINVKVSDTLVNNSTVSALSVTKGQKITLKGSASGGSGEYTYAYCYKKSGETSWKVAKNYSTAKSVGLTPATATTYNICIKVQDSNGAITKKYFNVAVNELVNSSYISQSTALAGDTVQFVGSASGGTGNSYKYSYYYKSADTTKWTLASDFSDNSVYDFNASESGEYDICIKVKDESGAVVKSYFTLTVKNELTLDDMVSQVTNSITDESMGDFEKAKAIHDWLVYNTEYDFTFDNASYTAEGLFRNGKAVCDGYAKAFLAMAEYAGLDAIRVTGIGYNSASSGGESHAWNQVKIDGEWYNVDVTWDDPVYNTEVEDNLSYKYFLIPDSVINNDHTAQSAKNSCTAEQPLDKLIPLALETLMEKNENCCYCESDSDITDNVGALFNQGIMDIKVIYKSDESMNDALNNVMNNCIKIKGIKGLGGQIKEWSFSGYYEVDVSLK